jgi:hypothetical protein
MYKVLARQLALQWKGRVIELENSIQMQARSMNTFSAHHGGRRGLATIVSIHLISCMGLPGTDGAASLPTIVSTDGLTVANLASTLTSS